MTPKFWDAVAGAYRASTAHTFTLHGDGTGDYAEGTVDIVPWLMSQLGAQFDLVLTFDPANGIQFALDEMRTLFMREVVGQGEPVLQAAPPGNPKLAAALGKLQQPTTSSGDLPRDPRAALPLLNQALRLTQRRKEDGSAYRVALVFPYAQLVFAAQTIGPLPAGEREALAFALSWAREPRFRAGNAPLIFFVTPGLDKLAAEVTETSYVVAVTAPEYDERLAFIETALNANGVKLAEDLTPRRLAAMTAGLLKVHIEDVIVRARVEDVPLTAAMAHQRKDEIMTARFSGVLETVEAAGSLDDIAGLDYLKRYLNEEIVVPMREGETSGMPMGVLMAGPPGTGKTYLAQKLAASAGVNFVLLRISNILNGIVGESEARLERALRGIQSMTPCIVFIDEVEQQFRRDTGNAGNSVTGNLFGRMLNAMSDTRSRGRVVWLMATNRPDLLDAAFKRSGRIDAKFAVMPPDNDDERAAMFRVMATKNGITLAANADVIIPAQQCQDYTGADIEVIVLKAAKVARRNGRTVINEQDLLEAVRTIRINASGEAQRMIALALAEVNDLDNLPPSYRARLEAGEFSPQESAPPPDFETPSTRQGRDLL